MGKHKSQDVRIVHYYSQEQIKTFKNMPVRARLQWLEEANVLINRTLGFKKRAIFDERFKEIA